MDIVQLQQRIDVLEQQMRGHSHNGFLGGQVYLKSLWGLFETVSSAPTEIPRSPYDQIKIYVNSTTYRLYWYDATGGTWHYVTATA